MCAQRCKGVGIVDIDADRAVAVDDDADILADCRFEIGLRKNDGAVAGGCLPGADDAGGFLHGVLDHIFGEEHEAGFADTAKDIEKRSGNDCEFDCGGAALRYCKARHLAP